MIKYAQYNIFENVYGQCWFPGSIWEVVMKKEKSVKRSSERVTFKIRQLYMILNSSILIYKKKKKSKLLF